MPHGVSLALTAPAVRFTAMCVCLGHLSTMEGASLTDAGEILVQSVIDLMRNLDVPNGLLEMGFTEEDIPQLVEGTLPQHRVTKLSPQPAGAEDLAKLFKDSMKIW